jgi:glutathione S-transferase
VTLSRFAPVLDAHMDGRKYLVDDQLTLADYSMAALEQYVTAVPFNFAPYRHIHTYFDRMRQSEHWMRAYSKPAAARPIAA